jgi:hypothetical protein
MCRPPGHVCHTSVACVHLLMNVFYFRTVCRPFCNSVTLQVCVSFFAMQCVCHTLYILINEQRNPKRTQEMCWRLL